MEGDLDNIAIHVLDHLSETVLITDNDLKILWCNAAAREQLSTSSNEQLATFLLKSPLYSRYYSDSNYGRLIREVGDLPYGNQQWLEADLCEADGIRLYQPSTIISWHRYQENLKDYVTFRIVCRGRRWKDPGVTKQREERQLSFMNRLAHEARTPIAVAKGYLRRASAATMLTEHPSQAYIRAATEEVDKLNRMFSNLAILTDAESCRQGLNIEPTNIVETISAWHKRRRGPGWEKLKYSMRGEPCRYYARADRKWLEKCLDNIVDNATRYDTSNQPVALHIEAMSTHVIISVVDWGPGICNDTLKEALGGEGHKKRAGRPPKLAGAGLGLSVSSMMMKEMQGSLRVVSGISEEDNTLPSTIVALRLMIDGIITEEKRMDVKAEIDNDHWLEQARHEAVVRSINQYSRDLDCHDADSDIAV